MTEQLSEMEGGDVEGDGGGARSHGGDMTVKSPEFMDELRKRMVDTRRRGYKELQKKAEERKRQLEERKRQLEEIKEKEREREEDDRRRRERKEKRQREEQDEEEKKRRKIQEKGKQKVNEHLGTDKEQWRGDASFRPMPPKVKPKIAIIETVKPPGQSEAHARRRRTQQALAQQKTLHAGFRQQNTPIASSEAAEAMARSLPMSAFMDIDTTTRRGSGAPSSASARGGGGGGGASGAVMRVQQRSNFAPSTSTQNQTKVALRLPASYGLAEYKNLEHAVLSARLLRDDDEETGGDANERPITASVGPSPNEFAHAQAYTQNFMPLLMDEGRAVRFFPPLSSQRYTNAIKHTRTPVSSYRPLFFLTRSVVRILRARACRALLRVSTRSRVCVYTHIHCAERSERSNYGVCSYKARGEGWYGGCACARIHIVQGRPVHYCQCDYR